MSFPRTWAHWSTIGPLLSTLAAPLVSETSGQSYIWFLQLPFLAVLLVSTYLLTRHLAGRFAGTAAVIVVALVPGTVWFSRTFQQIIPGAALWVLAVLCTVKSDRLRHRGWRVGLGVTVGVGLLTRTMLLGFFPYLALALAWQIARLQRAERPTLRGLMETTVPAVVIASTWWVPQWRTSWDYLSSAGLSGGSHRSISSLVGHEVQLAQQMSTPRLLLVLGGMTAVLVAVVAFEALAGRSSRASNELSKHRSEQVLVVGALIWGFTLLSISPNDFPGFELLNIPILVVVACLLFRYKPARILAFPIALLLMPMFSVYVQSDQSWYGQISSMLYSPEEVEGVRGKDSSDLADPSAYGSSWQEAADASLKWMHEYAGERGQRPNILMGNNRSLYGNNQYGIARYIVGDSWQPRFGWDKSELYTWDVQDAITDTDLESEQLRNLNFVVLIDPGLGMLRPPMRDSSAALREAGFDIVRKSELPDGSMENVWWRGVAGE